MDSGGTHSGGRSRRDFLKGGVMAAAGVAAGLLSGCNNEEACDAAPRATGAALKPDAEPSGFRFVHLTDIHVQPQLRAGEGFRKCLAAVLELKPRPDFILTGGDLVMDLLAADEPRSKVLFDLFQSICRDSDIPFGHCIGNHDILGWSKRTVAPTHALYGKKMFQERLNLEKTTYSFDHKGWRIAVVDDILPATDPELDYEGGFSEADLDWLNRDLGAAGERPKLVCTHIPVVSSVIFRAFNAAKPGAQNIADRAATCGNAGAILKVLKDHRVNLVLSGHLHENERIDYQGTTHIEDGAVCGAWWRGPNNGSPEGFGIIDAKADGTFEHQYHAYGWNA